MRRREGFISIVALIIMSVLLVMVVYLFITSQLGYLILNSSISKTRGYYQSEGKLYLSLYDENYYNNQLYLNIIDVFRRNDFNDSSKVVVLDELDLDYDDDEKYVGLKFYEKDNRIVMDMMAKTSNNEILTKLTSSGTLVNEIFESGYSILSYETVDEKHKEGVGRLLLQINEAINIDNCYKPETLSGFDLEEYSEITLKRKNNSNYELNCKRETMINPYTIGYSGREVIIISRKPSYSDVDFYIGEPDNPGRDIEITGILYVNGNIIISDNLVFKGILIVENGKVIINTSKKPKISGLVIINNIENYDDFIQKADIIRDKRMIYRYGTYLPGFLDPEVSIIKGN